MKRNRCRTDRGWRMERKRGEGETRQGTASTPGPRPSETERDGAWVSGREAAEQVRKTTGQRSPRNKRSRLRGDSLPKSNLRWSQQQIGTRLCLADRPAPFATFFVCLMVCQGLEKARCVFLSALTGGRGGGGGGGRHGLDSGEGRGSLALSCRSHLTDGLREPAGL